MTFLNHSVTVWSGIPLIYENELLENIVPRNSEQERYLKQIKDVLNGKVWCCICLGTVGNGKTKLAVSGVNSYNDACPYKAKYITYEGLIDAVKETYSDGNRLSEGSVIRTFQEVPVLVIDELKTGITDNSRSIIQKVLVQRHANHMKTILIGNITAEGLKSVFEPHLLSRFREGSSIVMTADDMRVKG